ncbi:MAG TPA: SIR2 family protein [Anaerolineales bacterium]|nr:SIR2 family protein [Anaerolineales bacterium]
MVLAGNSSSLLRNDQDRINYSGLIKLIQDSSSSDTPFSVFVGGGLSIQAGYPSSNELVAHLLRDANIEPAEINAYDKFPAKARRIKEIIQNRGDSFYEILYRRFDENHFQINRTIPLYQDLLRIPFRAFITTNYDSCIEEAADLLNIHFDEIQIYPQLKPNDLEATKLYHIHGKINQNDIPDSSRSIVLTTDDYLAAYGDESRLPVLMNALFDSHNILFIGFSLEEDALYELLQLSRKRNEANRGPQGYSLSNTPYKFAMLPYERKMLDPIKRKEDEVRNYMDTVTKQDQELLNNYGVIIIRYYANEIYSEIKSIVRDINSTTRVSSTEVKLDLVNAGVSV